MLKWSTGIKLVVHSHNIEANRFKSTGAWWWRILWYYERLVHRHADISFFISDEDKTYAIKHFDLLPAVCHTITYGFDLHSAPALIEKKTAREKLCTELGILQNQRLLFFNGTLDYGPNRDALDVILKHLLPLLEKSNLFYAIIICGKNLPAIYGELKAYRNRNLWFAGFVDDISVYFKGSDMFINPVTDGGGIKTKLVEALGYDLSCVSTVSGAIGVPAEVTNNKLIIVKDGDWNGFVEAILHGFQGNEQIGDTFFHYFQWNNIAEKAVKALNL
jgi:hypothetical protein